MSSTASDRFRRLLRILPAVDNAQRASLSALAEETGVPVEVIMDDLRALAERYDDPAGFMDGIGVHVEGDTLWIRTNPFRRPMRLSHSELRALEVGLALLRRELSDVEVVDGVLDKLHDLIAGSLADEQAGRLDGALTRGLDADALAIVRRALRDGMVVSVWYQRPHAAEATRRDLHPHRLRFSSGAWYLSAWCERTDGVRMFRADRIVSAEITNRPITHPVGEAELATLDDGTPFIATEQFPTLTVRFSPAVARWIAERDGKALETDGSAVRTMPLADREWAIRYVLQYGGEIEVMSPTDLRAELVGRLGGMVSQ